MLLHTRTSEVIEPANQIQGTVDKILWCDCFMKLHFCGSPSLVIV